MSVDSDEQAFIESLIQEFIATAPGELDSCETALLKFEKSKNPQDMLDFKRLVHSLKGSAQAVDFSDLSRCLHTLESKLEKAHQGNQTQAFIDAALPFIDVMREYLQARGENLDTSSLIKKLDGEMRKLPG